MKHAWSISYIRFKVIAKDKADNRETDRQTKTICPNHWIRDLPKKSDSQTMRYMTVFENNVVVNTCKNKAWQMDRQTDGCHEGQHIWSHMTQTRRKAAKSFRLKHSTIIIMKGFDKGVGDEHLFSPKLWPNSTATGESEIPFEILSL